MNAKEKTKKGRWKAGESGNPAGRKPGTGDVAKLRHGIAAHLPAIITALVSKAKDGDPQAARLLLERVLPALKPVEEPVVLGLPDGEGLTAQGVAIVQAVGCGTIAPGQGATLLAGLGALARIREVDELERRIKALEDSKHAQKELSK